MIWNLGQLEGPINSFFIPHGMICNLGKPQGPKFCIYPFILYGQSFPPNGGPNL